MHTAIAGGSAFTARSVSLLLSVAPCTAAAGQGSGHLAVAAAAAAPRQS